MSDEAHCCCQALADLAVIPMGGNGLDALVLASFKTVENHGGDQWWLYLATCRVCRQDWMVAQDERIYDNYYLRRLTAESKHDIVEWSLQPDEFLTYEQVLKLGRSTGRAWVFLESGSPALLATAEDLRRERPGITIDEIAYLLGITAPHAATLQSRCPFEHHRSHQQSACSPPCRSQRWHHGRPESGTTGLRDFNPKLAFPDTPTLRTLVFSTMCADRHFKKFNESFARLDAKPLGREIVDEQILFCSGHRNRYRDCILPP